MSSKNKPAVVSSNAAAVQQDWANRDFTQSVQLGVAQLAAFLNEFGALSPPHPPIMIHTQTQTFAMLTRQNVVRFTEATTRGKLSVLNGKLSKLERRMEFVEATLHSVDKGA